MADSKRYYYMKLKEDFYDSEELVILQAMPDGYLYSDILMKLYLQSLKSEGRLMYKDIIPYTPDILSAITHHHVGTIEKALKIFEKLKLIEILDNGAIYMIDIQNFIGQSSTEGDRKREYRNRINAEKSTKLLAESGQTSGQMSTEYRDECLPEYRDKEFKDIEIKDIEIKDEKDSCSEPSQKKKKAPDPEADVESIPLNDGTEWRPTISEYQEYVRLYPNVDVSREIAKMRGWSNSNPTKRKTHSGVRRFVNSWLSREQDKVGSHTTKSSYAERMKGWVDE